MSWTKAVAILAVIAVPIATAAQSAHADPATDKKSVTDATPAETKPTDSKAAAESKTPAESKAPAETKTTAETKAAPSTDAKTGEGKTETKKPTRVQLEAMLSKCSSEADAKGLSVAKGKGEARKAFRRECMHKMGVDPR